MRRRFRTATQLAIARGEPLPHDMREDYWGLGRLSGWTPQGLDRFGQVGLAGVLKEGGKWKSIPVLYEAVVEEADEDWTLLKVGPTVTPLMPARHGTLVETPRRHYPPRRRPCAFT
jgi:hypothetical protein